MPIPVRITEAIMMYKCGTPASTNAHAIPPIRIAKPIRYKTNDDIQPPQYFYKKLNNSFKREFLYQTVAEKRVGKTEIFMIRY
jgi:hypothetical protein